MKITCRQLNNLPVTTESGFKIGKIIDVEIDLEAHIIIKYIVKQGFLKELLLIAPTQVISISKEKMVVYDNIQKQKILATAQENIKTGIASPIIEKKRD